MPWSQTWKQQVTSGHNRGSGEVTCTVWALTSIPFLFIFISKKFIGAQLIYNAVRVLDGQQVESAIHIHISTLSGSFPVEVITEYWGGQGGLACCESRGCKELDTTERLNWTKLSSFLLVLYTVVCVCQAQSPSLSLLPPPRRPQKPYVWFLHLWLHFCFVCDFMCITAYIPHIRDFIYLSLV